MALTPQDIIRTLDKDMSEANAALMESPSERFNKSVLDLIQYEIQTGKNIAKRNKKPGSRTYVHQGQFPYEIYKKLSPCFLKELEVLEIFISGKDDRKTAEIRIVFHF